MIINTNAESTDKKIKNKYDFLFRNYQQLSYNNDDIIASYLITNWNVIINLTKLFEEKKFVFQILRPAKFPEYHYITFENNINLDNFVEIYKHQWKLIKENVDVLENLETILWSIDYDLLEYFEPIIHNYIIDSRFLNKCF